MESGSLFTHRRFHVDIGSGRGKGRTSGVYGVVFTETCSEVQLLNVQYVSEFPTWDNTFNS